MAKINTAEQIYAQLREQIVFLEILPGQCISEIDIAKKFGVSRTPIRDVFKRLEFEGLLQIVPQKGSFVTLIDISHLSDIMYLRETLEVSLVSDFMNNLQEAQLIKLQLLLLKQKKSFEKIEDPIARAKNFILADNEFHQLIFALEHKESLWELIAQTTPHYHRFRALHNVYNTKVIDNLCEEHAQLVECIKNQDRNKLVELYKKHIYGGLEDIAPIIDEYSSYFTS